MNIQPPVATFVNELETRALTRIEVDSDLILEYIIVAVAIVALLTGFGFIFALSTQPIPQPQPLVNDQRG